MADVRPGATGKAVPGYVARWWTTKTRCHRHGRPPCRAGPDLLPLPRRRPPARLRARRLNLTGDAYVMDEEGYFHYHSRTDDMIISSGYNIASPEVEDALMQHPAVAECGVIGAPDEERGQIVKAFRCCTRP